MIRIGLVGSESSHATAFATLCNIEKRFPGIRVTAIYGTDTERTRQVAAQCAIETPLSDPGQMPDMVDAAMILFRHGSEHMRYAMPFIERAIPTWVDKPFAISYSDALGMTNAAKKSGGLLSGGSTLRFCPSVLSAQQVIRQLEKPLISANFNFPCEIDSPYGGIYFYGGHSAEILITLFGAPLSVYSDVYKSNIISLFRYPNFAVTVHFSEVSDFTLQLYSQAGCPILPLPIGNAYEHGFAAFAALLQKTRPQEAPETLLLPVRVLNALEQSIATGRETAVK